MAKQKRKRIHTAGFSILGGTLAVSRFFGYLYPQPITWAWERGDWKPHPTPTTWKMIPWYGMSLIFILETLGLYGIGIREIVSFKKDEDFTLVDAIILTGIIAITTGCSMAVLTMGLKMDYACSILTSILQLDNNLELCKPHPLGALVYLVIPGLFAKSVLVVALPYIASDIDPSRFFVRGIPLPQGVLKALRALFLLLGGTHLLVSITLIAMYIITIGIGTLNVINQMATHTGNRVGANSRYGCIIVFLRRNKMFHESYSRYRQLQILLDGINQMSGLIVPTAFLAGGVLCATSAYVCATIRRVILPLVVYPFAIFTLVAVVITMQVLLPMGEQIGATGSEFLRNWGLTMVSWYRKEEAVKELQTVEN